jgi:penicillin amidase
MSKIRLTVCVSLLLVLTAGCINLFAVGKYRKNPSVSRYDDTLALPGLKQEVHVYRDQYAVPHIFAENDHDMYFAMGYVHAQDRLFEMVLFRAMASGRLCEILGDISSPMPTYKMDRRQRILGMKFLGDVSEMVFKQTHPEIASQAQAFCDGINAYINSHQEWKQMPVELQVLRYRPDPFTIGDIMSFASYESFILSGNLDEELLRYGLVKKHGPELGWQLMPLHMPMGPTIVPKEMLHNRLDTPRDLPPGGRPSAEELGELTWLVDADNAIDFMLAQSDLKRAFGADHVQASNNWVISSKLTETGTAMLANDPHLQHLEPSITYLMHVKAPGIDAYGATMPGFPVILMGHARKLAWGVTMAYADNQDLFVETVDPDQPGLYKYKGEWVPFVVREESIRVRTGSGYIKRKIKIRHSIHGPIINDIEPELLKDSPPIALRWTGWDFHKDLRVFEALIQSVTPEHFNNKLERLDVDISKGMNPFLTFSQMMRGESIDDFIEAMKHLNHPSMNWVGADADGRIIYYPNSLVPIRNKGIGVLPAPGESGDFDWTGFVPFEDIPHAIDPERGYMETANQIVVDAEWYPYIFGTEYAAGWRGKRIDELIRELTPISMEDMKTIQNDVYVSRAEWTVPKILDAIDKKKPSGPRTLVAADELREWDYQADLDNTAAIIFFQFLKELPKNLLMDELPEKDYQAFLRGGPVNSAIYKWLEQGHSPFADDRNTSEVEDLDDMLVKSLADAIAYIDKEYGPDPSDREWGKHHFLKWSHPLAIGPMKDLSVGPFPHLGADQTVRCATTYGTGDTPYRTASGSVLRHIIDLGDPDNAQIIIAGSQSGQWLSPHYDDMHEMYVKGEYITADKDPLRVKEAARYHTVMKPR